jgi:SAM-dependent methyltransferase
VSATSSKHGKDGGPVSEAEEDAQRKEREKQFHNQTFSLDDGRTGGSRFYTVTEPSSDAFEAEILRRAAGRTVLEYGCGPGTHSFRLAKVAKRVIGIDISEVAIERARRRAVDRGVDNVEFHVMDAESLTFPDATFDLVCGRAIVHHLDVQRCFSTISRVLRPGGVALFQEPLGHNPLINLYRNFTPQLRTVDEHPLLKRDLEVARSYFERVEMRPFVMLSLMAVPFNNTPLFKPLLRFLTAVDSVLFALPPLRLMAWTSIWILENPTRRAETADR